MERRDKLDQIDLRLCLSSYLILVYSKWSFSKNDLTVTLSEWIRESLQFI